MRGGGGRRLPAQRAGGAHLLLPGGPRPAAGLGRLLALAGVPLLPGPLAAPPPQPPRLAGRAPAPRVPHAQVRLVRARAARPVRRRQLPERRGGGGRGRGGGGGRRGGGAAVPAVARAAEDLPGAGAVRAQQRSQQQVPSVPLAGEGREGGDGEHKGRRGASASPGRGMGGQRGSSGCVRAGS